MPFPMTLAFFPLPKGRSPALLSKYLGFLLLQVCNIGSPVSGFFPSFFFLCIAATCEPRPLRVMSNRRFTIVVPEALDCVRSGPVKRFPLLPGHEARAVWNLERL